MCAGYVFQIGALIAQYADVDEMLRADVVRGHDGYLVDLYDIQSLDLMDTDLAVGTKGFKTLGGALSYAKQCCLVPEAAKDVLPPRATRKDGWKDGETIAVYGDEEAVYADVVATPHGDFAVNMRAPGGARSRSIKTDLSEACLLAKRFVGC